MSATQGGADVYQWVDCGKRNQPLDGATDQAFTPDVAGSYAVSITLGPCTQLSECSEVDVWVDESSFSAGILVSPNPTNGAMMVTFGKRQGQVTVQVLDALGQVVTTRGARNADRMSIELAAAPGLYLLTVENGQDGRPVMHVLLR